MWLHRFDVISQSIMSGHNNSHLEDSSTSVGRPGHCQSPVLAVENVDVCQPILLDVSFDGIHVSQFRSSSRSHTFYHHVQHCLGTIICCINTIGIVPAYMQAKFVTLWLQVLKPLTNVHHTIIPEISVVSSFFLSVCLSVFLSFCLSPSFVLKFDFQENRSHDSVQTRPMCCPETCDVHFDLSL